MIIKKNYNNNKEIALKAITIQSDMEEKQQTLCCATSFFANARQKLSDSMRGSDCVAVATRVEKRTRTLFWGTNTPLSECELESDINLIGSVCSISGYIELFFFPNSHFF